MVLVEPVGFSQNLPLFDTQHKPVRENINRSLTGSYSDHVGGDKRDRTADLLNAIQALSQLSYTPDLRKSLSEQHMV